MLKKLKLIYNPNSGDKMFKDNLDLFIKKMQGDGGYEVHPFRTIEKGDIDRHINKMNGDYDALCVSGGDGTLNIVINALMKNGKNHIPIGIIPSGTANDFASFLKIPKDVESACDVVLNGVISDVDLGFGGDKYFINVCAGGLFSDISSNVNTRFKDTIGKAAYYIKGIEQIPGYRPIPMRITNSKDVFEEDIYLFLVLNSSGTGGVKKLSPQASVNDGMFDFVAFKGVALIELSSVIVKFFKGEHLNDDKVIYFQDNYIKVENLADDKRYLQTDFDGEKGPNMPFEIKNIHGAVKIFTHKESVSEN